MLKNTYQSIVKVMLLRPLLFRAQRPVSASFARRFSASVFEVPRRHICVVGSGPGGFYATKYLLKEYAGAQVDMLEELPTPFGLVRSGVAPDHPEVKLVMNDYTKLAADKRFRFVGNVRVGEDVTLSELKRHYHAVVLAYGAADDSVLGIPGENLRGVMSARSFVYWYNGHPAFRDVNIDLTQTETVVIFGQGNVALDCARILTKNVEELAITDIATHAVKALRTSRIKNVYIIGRRGSAQAAFTIKEVRELTNLNGVACVVDPKDIINSMTVASKVELQEHRARKRMSELLEKAAERFNSAIESKRTVQIKFLSAPVKIFADEKDPTRVGAIVTEKNKLTGEPNNQCAVGTGEFETIPCGLVLRSIGYKSLPIETNIPFDKSRSVIMNDQGRIVTRTGDGNQQPVLGFYCTGWVKRGPSGIIGTNTMDARETVRCIVDDFASGNYIKNIDESICGLDAVEIIIKKRKPDKQLVRWVGYERINAEEIRRGKLKGKPREKITSVDEMLEIANHAG
ncbi:uncharacterized protein CCR75_003439 [Bremia lactucae]|uniref:NADPH:adrenodoxin oxidoreductase, mitochondrial n=1 Tax=Bremia lactucae TaxID=4779 RepID=A0A976IHI5_BRELC|nr:hypothetical protein CCR75_003439 [Bremia lactucae]